MAISTTDDPGAPRAYASVQPEGRSPDPDEWVDRYADLLYRHAFLRVRDAPLAEDLVQETFLAAWKGRHRFRGNSSEKTWLFAILKNKIMDYFRKASREISFTDLQALRALEHQSFRNEGWHKDAWTTTERPEDWHNAPSGVNRHEFWTVLQTCLGKLPRNLARAFLLREMDDVEAKEICATLDISSSNLWVMLHRARLGLRRCLEKHWFRQEETPPPEPKPS